MARRIVKAFTTTTFEGVALRDTGPLQIVVPLDKRPARWVRQVTKLEVRDVK